MLTPRLRALRRAPPWHAVVTHRVSPGSLWQYQQHRAELEGQGLLLKAHRT